MPYTNNLGAPQMSPTQNQKSQTSNDANGTLDAAMTAEMTVLVDDTNAVTIAEVDVQQHVAFILTPDTPVPTALVAVTVDPVIRGLFFAVNDTAEDSEWEISGQSEPAVEIPAGANRLLYSNGTDIIEAAGSLASLGTMAYQNASAVAITGGSITGLPTPTVDADAANKEYVDDEVASGGLNALAASQYATVAVLPDTPTYNNGTAGVGATLTAGANGALSVDNIAVSPADRILVKDQAAAEENGIYTVTDEGDGSNPYVLTRVTDFDQAAEMKKNSFTYIQGGDTLVGSSWLLGAAVATVGTDPLDFVQFAGGGGGGGGVDPFGAKVPQLSSWTSFGSSLTTNEGGTSGGLTPAITLSTPYSNTPGWKGIYRAAPSTPYLITAFITGSILDSFNGIGIGFYNAGAMAILCIMGRQGGSNVMLNKFNYSNPTTYASGSNLFVLPVVYEYGLWLGIENDGTNINYGILPDGVNFKPLITETVAGGYLGPSGWGNVFFGINGDDQPIPVTPLYDMIGLLRCWDENGLTRTLASVYG